MYIDPAHKFYTVMDNYRQAPLSRYVEHGFELQEDYRDALKKLISRWHDRIGECIDERNGFKRLRFHDTPSVRPDEEWLPDYLLGEMPPDTYKMFVHPDKNSFESELDRAFGFDF